MNGTNNDMSKRFLAGIIGCWFLWIGSLLGTQAQTVKEITLSQEHSFTDHIALANDSRDLDLMVKLVFNESENTLTVSLVSYRDLFVFQDDVPFQQAIKGDRLRPDRLPYVVQSDPKAQFVLDKSLKASLEKPHKKLLFHRWITYQGLQPQPIEYKMVNEFIEQTFDIQSKNNRVQVTLHDLFVMEPHLHKPIYRLVCQKDVNTVYEIYIQRNPCFQKEEEINELVAKVEAIAAGYHTLTGKFGIDAVTDSEETVNLFQENKQLLLQQFPVLENKSRCEQIQEQVTAYQNYRDSIQALTCTYLPPEAPEAAPRHELILLEVSPEQILSMARQIDNCVGRWMLTDDQAEKQDLENYCIQIISRLNEMIQEADTVSPEQEAAIVIFRRAEKHFEDSCQY